MKHKKTNAMRMLDRAKIKYEVNTYEVGNGHMDGTTVAKMVGADVKEVYKTLVLENANHDHYVFVIPVDETLDMKAAAQVVNEKKLQLMPLDNLKQVTGYIRGGCSPVGMKHLFKTTLNDSALALNKIIVSGGQRGMQIVLDVNDLIDITQAQIADIIQK
ncbi:Cys-tRNA(Pro) deacylase [Staphylococcus devriesei]|uniref:Cys-tRNA(Pro)/Cys-tRNA(Cys) deacylase n=1 Tax=Staphylococcus devriesei TaxID=586733 RepID=A0A2K4DUY3_9STAP|nr:Cys-tRNA(Pro) deacylase [Staphylococcus devriesei]MCE5090575.1 Cys-tRNA(Pro) deacylase [Staphylococcus devriesei]MCE5096703.1 Cys-tRNA(Pro) deacylase [Staphylococcus devriesei]PNZ90645.1 Cys-tRNA(Pro) deacylase [Staphylococcus devriesei]PTE74008.1 Cys-tRNA(Pro) deacylase [Staphylococcus devriesei]PTF05105.1 Cys-tRNA(Pro) deacylase [Staphylococcus devriesei]